jgi:hypothetical protein
MQSQTDHQNPYESPGDDGAAVKRGNATASKTRRLIAMVSSLSAVCCLVATWACCVALVQVGLWHQLPPDVEPWLYQAVDKVGSAFVVVGFLACVMAFVTGSWVHRCVTAVVALLFTPFLGSVWSSMMGWLERLF